MGSFEAVKELEAKSRDGLVRVVLEVDLVQRLRGGRMDLGAFGRRAFLDLLKQTKDESALLVLPLFGITQKGVTPRMEWTASVRQAHCQSQP